MNSASGKSPTPSPAKQDVPARRRKDASPAEPPQPQPWRGEAAALCVVDWDSLVEHAERWDGMS